MAQNADADLMKTALFFHCVSAAVCCVLLGSQSWLWGRVQKKDWEM